MALRLTNGKAPRERPVVLRTYRAAVTKKSRHFSNPVMPSLLSCELSFSKSIRLLPLSDAVTYWYFAKFVTGKTFERRAFFESERSR